MLEGVGVRRETGLREQGGEDAIPAALSDVKRLGHRPEIGLHAGGQGYYKAQRPGRLLLVERQKSRRRGHSPEDPERRRRMPALFVVGEVDGAADPGLDLESGHVGGKGIAPGDAVHLAEGYDGGHQRNRGMAAEHGAHVVVVQRMRGRPVDQNRAHRIGAPVVPEDQARPVFAADAGKGGRNARRRFAGTGERHADRIRNGLFRPENRFLRQIFVTDGMKPFGEFLSDVHSVLPKCCRPSESGRILPWPQFIRIAAAGQKRPRRSARRLAHSS